LPTVESHPFYTRVNQLLREHGFDDFAEPACHVLWRDDGSSQLGAGDLIPPAVDWLFEGIDSERGIA
jgi:hypothetical protein